MHDREAVQLSVGRAIESDALPYYTKPFPKFPRARDAGGRYRRISAPFYGASGGEALTYERYIDRARRGLCPFRSIHGPIHAARVALWAGLLSVLFDRHGLDQPQDLFELQMAAAFHDAGRQDEGCDRWEQESNRIYARWLRRSHPEVAWPVDDTAESSTRLRLAILKDADILDIQRVLRCRNEFDASRLSFWNDPRIPLDVQRDLVEEVHRFIAMTEDPTVKRELEDSAALYFNLMHLIVDARRRFQEFRLLRDLLGELAGQPRCPT